MNIDIRIIDCSINHDNNRAIGDLAEVLSYEEPEMLETYKGFWNDWLSNKIIGEKITIVAEQTDNSNQRLVGVVRFWKTPYCNDKWLIEGLEVISIMRRKGIGGSMVSFGLNKVKELGIKNISANISTINTASIRLFKSLGFTKISSGSINSYGDYREQVDEYSLTLIKD